MNIHELSPVVGSTHVGKRKGRGHATGNGKTAGRGHKGAEGPQRRRRPHRLRRRPDASGAPHPEARFPQHLRQTARERERLRSGEV